MKNFLKAMFVMLASFFRSNPESAVQSRTFIAEQYTSETDPWFLIGDEWVCDECKNCNEINGAFASKERDSLFGIDGEFHIDSHEEMPF